MPKRNVNSFAVVITSINAPTAAVKAYAQWRTHTIVVGDKKSPPQWDCDGVHYMSWPDTELPADEARLAEIIGPGTYTRKMLGYVAAARRGAEFIFETDDDNIPYSGALRRLRAVTQGREPWKATRFAEGEGGWVNMYAAFTKEFIWPRGFPLDVVGTRHTINPGRGRVGVIQYLADGDPDVDAIYRLLVRKPVHFSKSGEGIALKRGMLCPFNSQATLWRRSLFPLMYLPIRCGDRVTDILRGLLVARALESEGVSVLFETPIVYQERNPHNLLRDFEAEVSLHTRIRPFAEKIRAERGASPAENLRRFLSQAVAEGLLEEVNLQAYDLFSKLVAVVN